MTRIVTYGQQPMSAPPGTFREIHFPQLMYLDEGTKEGMISRLFTSDGFKARDLPRQISFQYSNLPMHLEAVPVGALHEVTANGETKRASGKGWLSETPMSRLAEICIISQSLMHNSADLADIAPGSIEFIEHGDFWDDDFYLEIRFTDYALGKTTIVALPAFANCLATLPGGDELTADMIGPEFVAKVAEALGIDYDELTASLDSNEPLVVGCPPVASAHTQMEEIMASATSLPNWDHFHRPESLHPHKVIVGTPDADGWIPVYGNLGQWDVPHAGYDGEKRYIPRPQQNYREFNQPGVLTTRGQVETGPIVLLGGHVSLRDAAGDPRNAWADVKVSVGKHGPWVCGVVRPHVSEDQAKTYIARASRLSGHWKGNDLKMIISCSSEGFNIPGIGSEPGEPDELVASFVDETEAAMIPIPRELLSLMPLSEEAQRAALAYAGIDPTATVDEATLLEQARAHLAANPDQPLILKGPAAVLDRVRATLAAERDDEFDVDAAADERERELALEAEA